MLHWAEDMRTMDNRTIRRVIILAGDRSAMDSFIPPAGHGMTSPDPSCPRRHKKEAQGDGEETARLSRGHGDPVCP